MKNRNRPGKEERKPKGKRFKQGLRLRFRMLHPENHRTIEWAKQRAEALQGTLSI